MIPYSTRQKITKIRQKISHNPIEETVFALAVGELVLTDMKMFTKAIVMVPRIPILPGLSGLIVKLTCKLEYEYLHILYKKKSNRIKYSHMI